MNADDFNHVIEAQIERSTSVLINKAAEYATDDDRLHNFKVAAAMQGCTPSQALVGMMAKHTTSIFDMVGTGEGYATAMWNEKITDHINYLLLLRAVVEEEHNNRSDENVADQSVVPPYRQPAFRTKEDYDKAIEDQTALNDIAAALSNENDDDKIQSVFDIVEKVRVIDDNPIDGPARANAMLREEVLDEIVDILNSTNGRTKTTAAIAAAISKVRTLD